MGATFRFLADPNEPPEVLAWFRALATPPVEHEGDGCIWVHFAELGPLDRADPRESPAVALYLPRVRRGVLWTVGEVHFLPTSIRARFPAMDKFQSAFRKWIRHHECVFARKPGFKGEWDHYLEGSIRNYDPPVHALPSGLAALQAGRYFVADDDPPAVLDRVCRSLRLRGIDCAELD